MRIAPLPSFFLPVANGSRVGACCVSVSCAVDDAGYPTSPGVWRKLTGADLGALGNVIATEEPDASEWPDTFVVVVVVVVVLRPARRWWCAFMP